MLNLCQEGEKVVVERLGRFHAVYEPGWFVSLPLVDRLAYVIDMRERSLDVASSTGVLTKDNIAVQATGTLFMAFADAHKAAYGSSNPFIAVRHQAQLAMRLAISERSLDDILRSRHAVNDHIVDALHGLTPAFGVHVRAFAVRDVSPENRLVSEAIDRLALTERQQLHARAESEGAADAARYKAHAIAHESRANADAVREIAQAEADATRLRAAAAADAIRTVAAVLRTSADRDAARFVLAQDHIHQSRQPLTKLSQFDMPEISPYLAGLPRDDRLQTPDLNSKEADSAS